MKTFKKCFYFIFAFLPVILIVVNVFTLNPVVMPFGSVNIVDNVLNVTPDSWSAALLEPLGLVGDFNGLGGLFPASVGFLSWLQTYAGIVPSMPLVLVVWYMVYMFFIELMFFVFDLLLFVPRKVKELFER